MANTEIDSLSLEIEIKGLDEKQVNNLDRLSRAISRLSKSLENADFSKLKNIKLPKGINNIQFINQTFKEQVGGASSSSGLKQIQEDVEGLGDTFSEEAQKIEDGSLKITKSANKTAVASKNAGQELKKAKEAIEGKSKKNGFVLALGRINKALGRIKLIAFIKMIRAILNAIAKGIKEGITNLAGFDKEFNDTMSRLKTAWTTISNSFGLIARPILEVIEPAVTQISQAVAVLGNEISKIQATMKGASSYTKVSAKYMDDFATYS